MTTTTTTEPFSLSGPREEAFWRAIADVGIDRTASALTLVRAVLTLRDRGEYADAVGAAAELRYHLGNGRPIEFRQRPGWPPNGEAWGQ